MKALELIAGLCGQGEKVIGMVTPVFDLALRIWVAKVFFMSGLTKIQSWETTLFLFEYEYEVPLLSPTLAAWSGTAAELILPVFLVLGFLSRPVALALFVFNAIAVYSYGSFLFGDHGAAGLQQHILWGVMLLVTLFHGPGKLSLDALVMKRFGGAGN
jgi:putative oxidoreductase